MPDLTPEIVDDVVAACKAGAGEAAEAFSRALDGKLGLLVGESGTLDMSAAPEDLSGPGLVVVLTAGSAAAVLVLPESSGLVPEWCAAPDPTGESKLTTLAQELGMILLPEQFMPDDFKCARVKNLAGALRRGGIEESAASIALELSAEGRQGTARLVWPAPKPDTVVGSAPAKPEPAAKPQPKAKPAPAVAAPVAAKPAAALQPKHQKLTELPKYSRSLLRIKVPVVVTLAEKNQPLGQICELGPGSIIQFDKSCEEMLELNVGNRPVASGEAVKVGDKFGLRITSIIMPEERFHPVRPGQK